MPQTPFAVTQKKMLTTNSSSVFQVLSDSKYATLCRPDERKRDMLVAFPAKDHPEAPGCLSHNLITEYALRTNAEPSSIQPQINALLDAAKTHKPSRPRHGDPEPLTFSNLMKHHFFATRSEADQKDLRREIYHLLHIDRTTAGVEQYLDNHESVNPWLEHVEKAFRTEKLRSYGYMPGNTGPEGRSVPEEVTWPIDPSLSEWLKKVEEDEMRQVNRYIKSLRTPDVRGRIATELHKLVMDMAWRWRCKTENVKRLKTTVEHTRSDQEWMKLFETVSARLKKDDPPNFVGIELSGGKGRVLPEIMWAAYAYEGEGPVYAMQDLIGAYPDLGKLNPRDPSAIATTMNYWLMNTTRIPSAERLAQIRVLLYMFGTRFACSVLSMFHQNNPLSPVRKLRSEADVTAYLNRYEFMCGMWCEANWLNQLSRISPRASFQPTPSSDPPSSSSSPKKRARLTSDGGMAVGPASGAPAVKGAVNAACGGQPTVPVLVSTT